MAISKQSRFIRGSVIAVVIVYAAACIAPAVDTGPRVSDDDPVYRYHLGMFAFLFGMISFLQSILNQAWSTRELNFIAFIWTANPLGLTALILIALRRWDKAILTGGIAFGLTVLYMIAAEFHSFLPQPLFGAYLWSASMAMILRAALVGYWVYDKPIEAPNSPPDPIETPS